MLAPLAAASPLEGDETADVTATIENVGALEGTHNVSLLLGDETKQSTSLTLAPGERETLVFELTADGNGDQQYTVEAVNDATVDGSESNAVTVIGELDDTDTDLETQSSSDGTPGFGVASTVVALIVVTSLARYC
ncbi:hypothetical protein C495_05993 [Natronorubrum sulfidifaciens JCM 14089]|uniref:CARDB domain-containing protein n=1 Tax=Natronorubrum sulfidifaciens JCM 14089 TaxID=1230460 RepID=L9WAW8_9EURY|nr:hypothetical protein C495_05993 [Natronorubrum sulfidifaciens JCM 14089]